MFFCGTTRPNTKRQNAESDRSRHFSFPGHFSQYFRHFPAPAPTRRQLSVRRKNDCAPERDPQVSPGTPQKKVSNSHTLRSTAAKSEQPVFSGGARKTVAESAGELTACRRVEFLSCGWNGRPSRLLRLLQHVATAPPECSPVPTKRISVHQFHDRLMETSSKLAEC